MNSIHQEILTIDKFCDNIEQIIKKAFIQIQEEIINKVKIVLQDRDLIKNYFSCFKYFICHDLKIIEQTISKSLNIIKENNT